MLGEIYRVSMIGHRVVEDYGIEEKLYELFWELLRTKEYVEFYLGRNGDFDILAASVIKRLHKNYRDDRTLKPGGIFLFNIEHPVFTAGVGQDWIYTDDGKPQYWAIDNYFITGERNTHFLGCDVVKQHHTLTQIIMGLLNNGFELKVVEEAEPPKEMMDIPGMEDELRRPMMLLVKAIAKK